MKKLIFALALLISTSAHAADLDNAHVIMVNGIGEVEVAVDNVTINLNISTRNKDLKAAKADNQKKYDAVLDVITKKFGLPRDVIKANFVSMNPSYVPCYPTPQNPQPKCDETKIDFYNVNRSLEIKLSDLTKYDDLVESLATDGVSVNTGQYGVTDITKYRDQARDQAIDSAKAKAVKTASKLEVKLLKPIRFESYDNSAESPIAPRPMMMKAMNVMASAPATDTETMGKMKITVTVNIAYQIE